MGGIASTSINVHVWSIGTVEVSHVAAEPSLEPRLAFSLVTHIALPMSLKDRQVAVLGWTGELILAKTNAYIAPLTIDEPYRSVHSGATGGRSDFKMFLELSWTKLAQIEMARGGKGPDFTFRLLPRMSVDGTAEPPSWLVFPGTVPIEDWIRVLEALGSGRFQIVPLRFPPRCGATVQSAEARLADAWRCLERGAFEAALVSCRKSLEAMAQAVEGGKPAEVLKKRVAEVLGAKKGDEIGRVISGLMSLLHLAAHETGAGDFSRADAEFALHATTAVISLVAECTARRPQ